MAERSGHKGKPTRRAVLAGGAASVLTAAGFRPGSASAAPHGGHGFRLTVMGTTDLHGHLFNWDYFKNAEFDDGDHNDVGLAKVATLAKAVREERGRDRTLLIDAGDTIQGTSLAYYYAKIEPIGHGTVHPMARAMNMLGFRAAALGNHEFNYGIPLLRTFEDQCDFPLLGANAVDWNSRRPAFRPYVIERVHVHGGPPVRVGILGLTNPGIAIWDKHNVDGKLRFPALVDTARRWVPRVRAAGADIVVVSAHSGASGSSSYGDAIPYVENASAMVARQVPGIDAILVGHAHVEIPQRYVTNEVTGTDVVLSEPLCWGERLTLLELDLEFARGRWRVADRHAQVLNSNTVAEDEDIKGELTGPHKKAVAYVNSPIGTCEEAMSAATARYEDSAALDFINYVQAQAVKDELAGDDRPVLSIAAPFNREAAIPAGKVSVRDVAGLYVYYNTLLAIVLTGAQIKDYLEKSAEYFKHVDGTGPYKPDEVTGAPTKAAPNGTPDYNYDVMAGLDAALSYDIDIAKAAGKRITDLTYGGKPVKDDQEFVIAINNYRQSGGGGFPHVTDAEVVYNQQQDIRQLLIDWVTDNEVIDPSTFFSRDWRLTAHGDPVRIEP